MGPGIGWRWAFKQCQSGSEEELLQLRLAYGAEIDSSSRPMARKCWIERNKRKAKTVAKYADLRHQLKKEKDYVGLTMLPRDASPTRLVNRCEVTGRRRGFLRRFRLSRIAFRQMASHGLIPGVTKSSW
jgi:small subunit ribosomal protein S14